jgi:hypothetical protein
MKFTIDRAPARHHTGIIARQSHSRARREPVLKIQAAPDVDSG